MTLHVLDIPDDPAELAGWLEQHLIGLDLKSVVCQLQAFNAEDEGGPADLREALAEWYEQVLAGGLKLLPVPVLQRLLARPSLLLELQEEVCVNGGRYWDRLESPSEEIKQLVASSKARLEEQIRAESEPGPRPARMAPVDSGRETQTLRFEPSAGTRTRWVGAVVALAACVLVLLGTVGFLVWNREPTAQPAAVAWGWSKPGVLDMHGTPSEYLNHLADAAEQWNNKRPEEPRAIIQRLHEFRMGCSDLILAPHEPLAEEDRAWLRERCQAWAKKVDEHIARAEAGEALEARADADETVRKLVKALRTRAAEV